MLPDRVSNPGPLTYESGALPIALRGPAPKYCTSAVCYGAQDIDIASLDPIHSFLSIYIDY